MISPATDSPPIVLRELQTCDREPWDALVRSLPSSCFMQSWAWSEFKQREDYQIGRYGVFAGSELVGGSLIYAYPWHGGANLLLAPGAPVFRPGYEEAGFPLLLQQAHQLAGQFHAIGLRLEPQFIDKPPYLQQFVRAPADLLPSETLVIDLTPSGPEILARMRPKGRYNVRLSQRYGVRTHFSRDDQAIPQFYDLFWETVQRQEFFGEPYGFFINLCQTLFAANLAEVGFATWRGEVLATVLIVYWGDRATYLYGGRRSDHPQVMAAYGLHWAAMQRAKARGCRLYDWYGYTQNPQHGYTRFSQFKRQWGGTPVTTIGAQDYFFYDRLSDTLITTLHRLRE